MAARPEPAALPRANGESKVQEQVQMPAANDSDLSMWAEWLGGVLCCCFQREGH